MTGPHDISDDALDALASGRVPEEPQAAELAMFLTDLRATAGATTTVPNQALRSVLTDGITPATSVVLSAAAAQLEVAPPTTTSAPAVWGRGRTWWRVGVTKLAALGMLAKAGVAGATVLVAVTGAGAAGVLPDGAQQAFDRLVTDDAGLAELPPEPVDTTAGTDDTSRPDGAGVDGRSVACDATGGAQDGCADDAGDVGVDGRTVACDASADRARPCDDSAPLPAAPARPDLPATQGGAPPQPAEQPAEVPRPTTQSDEPEQPVQPEQPELGRTEDADGRGADGPDEPQELRPRPSSTEAEAVS